MFIINPDIMCNDAPDILEKAISIGFHACFHYIWEIKFEELYIDLLLKI